MHENYIYYDRATLILFLITFTHQNETKAKWILVYAYILAALIKKKILFCVCSKSIQIFFKGKYMLLRVRIKELFVCISNM